MNRNALYIRVLLVLIALVVLLAFFNRSPRRNPGDTWLPSSFNPVGAGSLAFYDTLHDLGWPVSRWREPLSRLFTFGTGNTLIITRSAGGMREAFSDQEIELLDRWVERGNTLVLLGALDEWDDTREMLRHFGFVLGLRHENPLSALLRAPEAGTERPIELPPPPGAASSGTLVLPPSAPLPITYPSRTNVLRAQNGQPYLIEVPHGAGRVVCGASARLLSNGFLPRGDNLAIVLGLLAPEGRVPAHLFFEESHHGFSAVFAVAHLLRQPGLRFGGMLTLLGLLAFLAGSLVRFGPVLPLERAGGRSTLEFVDSVADLYRRADLRNDTIEFLYRETLQRVQHRLNLPPTAPSALVAARLKEAYPHLPSWKKLAQRFESSDYVQGLAPSGWMRLARDLIQIKSAMA